MAVLLAAVIVSMVGTEPISAALPVIPKAAADKQVGKRIDIKDRQDLIEFRIRKPPQFDQGYPRVGAEQPAGSKTVEILIKSNQSGTAYYLVTRDSIQPISRDILQDKGRSGTPFITRGKISISANVETKLLIDKLPDHGAAYNVYVVVQDENDSFSQVKKVTVKTPPDKLSNIATVTSSLYIISAAGTSQETIVNVPIGTGKTQFLTALTKGHPKQDWDITNIHDPVQTGDTLVVTAQDGTTQVTYTIQVNISEPTLDDYAFNNYQVNLPIKAVDFNILTSGGVPPYTYNVSDGKLPPGLKLYQGVLQGTPSAVGRFDFAVTVSDSVGNTDTNQYTIKIDPADVLITSITVSGEGGATRVRNGRTLQMTTKVKPEDATNKTVTWKVVNGTGRADISVHGLLTAYSTGTVTVKAYANDGSGVVGSRVITIYRSSSSDYYWDDDWYYGDDWVDEGGGKIKEKGVTVVFPRNAVDRTVQINITKSSSSSVSIPSDKKLVSDVFNITKNVSDDFDRDVTIILPFDRDKADRDDYEVSLYYWNGRRWIELDSIDVDWSDETVSGKIDHLGKFAVLATKKVKAVKPEPKLEQPKPQVLLKDINGHWAEASIRSLAASRAISGYPDGTFKPNQPISRAEFATVIVKVLGLSATGTKLFEDTQGHWGRYTIAAAYEAGIVSGYDAHRFGPDDPITREQIAVMIARAARLGSTSSQLTFTDSYIISPWAREFVARATAHRIITGYPDNTFQPHNAASRAEAAAIVNRALVDK